MTKRIIFISIAVVMVGWLIIRDLRSSKQDTIEQALSYLIYPFLRAAHYITSPVKNVQKTWRLHKAIAHNYQQLHDTYEQAQDRLIALSAQKLHKDDIAPLTQFAHRYSPAHATICSILEKNISDQQHVMFIDGGANRKFTTNMIVTYNHCLLGKISEVYSYYSKVTLITDRSCKVAVTCVNGKACGIHEGINQNTTSHIVHINHLATLHEDDLVLSSGQGLVFPAGFGVGTIKSFHTTGLFITAIVQPLIDIYDIKQCVVLDQALLGQIPDHDAVANYAHLMPSVKSDSA